MRALLALGFVAVFVAGYAVGNGSFWTPAHAQSSSRPGGWAVAATSIAIPGNPGHSHFYAIPPDGESLVACSQWANGTLSCERRKLP